MCNLHDKKNHLLFHSFLKTFFTCLSACKLNLKKKKKKVPHLIYIPKSFSLNKEKKITREIRIYVAMGNSDNKLYFNGVITVFFQIWRE